MITGIKESKTLTKHISCKCKCKFIVENLIQIKSEIIIIIDSIWKNIIYVKKITFGI